ncbi:hypothetical protein [Enterobacter ludwigii]|uniref:hypothetical protein n=1 Tax=Enterobacter ludwigii TaxID=299767 RepID=UPI001E51CDA4|nr:hypothetical protein [Enterobacter ludwigii]MCE1613387.1 hypothetical protein [Enterobacter ludwigii]MCE1626688.1 hypothetical protein [Enterobacter ludwigii]
MKKKLLTCLILAMGTMTGAAHAQWETLATAETHAEVKAEASWTLAEKTPGQWKTDGTALQPLVMEVGNKSAATPGRFSLSTDAQNFDDAGWFMTKDDDVTQKINLQVDDAKLQWDTGHHNYKFSENVAQGNNVVLSFTPKAGQTLTAGNYKMNINLMVEHP